MKCHFILYVSDQVRSAEFYSKVLSKTPSLDVPGMTEFTLGPGVILGLMPEKGIVRLLGTVINDPASANQIPRAELYLRVDSPESYMTRAILAGGRELSPMQSRNWGDIAGYCADPDGHVIAFAKSA